MRRRLRITLLVIAGLLVLIALCLGTAYWALQQVPEFYQQAMAADAAAQKRASDEMLQRSTALLSDTRNKGRWEALFAAQQINGWLAVDLANNYPDALSEGVSDPRIAIRSDGIQVACRLKYGSLTSVVSLVVEPYLAEPNVVAVRIREVRAGLMPLPMSEILDRVSQAARTAELKFRWEKAGGDPVLVITLPAVQHNRARAVRIETLRLGEDEIYVAGTTQRQ